MKKILLSVLSVLSFNVALFAQNFRVVQVLNEQNFLLTSSSNISSGNRVTIPLVLPRNTVRLLYSVNTKKNTNSGQTLYLLSQFTRLYGATDAMANITNEILTPKGYSKCDVFLLPSEYCGKFYTSLDLSRFKSPFSRENFISGVVDVPFNKNMNRSNYCVGFRNKSLLEGVYISLEVIAVVVDE